MSLPQRDSQESKVTSTPQKISSKTSSPTCSTINSETSSTSVATIRRNISGGSVKTLSTHEPSDNLSGSDSNILNLKAKSIKKTGKFWKTFKPMSDNTLYAKIFSEPSASQELAGELLLKFKANPKSVILSILKLLIDISGFQHFEIEDIYDYNNCDAKRAISHLCNQKLDDPLHESGVYLMQSGQNKDMVIIKTAIYSFFYKLMIIAHRSNILYHDLFAIHIFEFIRCMAFSILMPMKHAGILITLKLFTGCSKVQQDIKRDYNKSLREVLPTNMDRTLAQTRKLSLYLDFLYLIYTKNCLIPGKQSHHVRAECIEEMIIWIDYVPEKILNDKKSLDLIRKLMLDDFHTVRSSALNTFAHLVRLEVNPDEMAPKIRYLLETAGSRIYDINYSVAVKVCKVFIKLVEKHLKLVELKRMKQIMQLIYHKNYELAKAAAEVVISYLRMTSRNDSDILISIADIAATPILVDKNDILVESLLPCTPELCHWRTFVSLFLNKSLSSNLKHILVQIFYETTLNLLTDKSPRKIARDIVNAAMQKETINRNILIELMQNAVELLDAFGENDDSKVLILKTICILDMTNIRSNFNVTCSEIINSIAYMIIHSDNSDLIDQGVLTIAHFQNNIPDFKRRASNYARNIAKGLVADFKNYIQNVGTTSTPADIKALYTVTLRLSKFFKSFDLTELIDWTDLFQYMDYEISETAENCVICAKYYLIWSMRNIIEDHENRNTHKYESLIMLIARRCSDYVISCFTILNNNRGSSLEIIAFESICDLALTYHSHLENQIKYNFSLKSLEVKLDESNARKIIDYFTKCIIGNGNLTLGERYTHFGRVVDLVYNEILPSSFFFHLMKMYCIYYEDYQEIFDDIIKQFQKFKAFASVIFHTLVDNYRNLLSKYQAVNIQGDEFQNICLLAKKLSKIKTTELYDIVRLGMNYALRDETHHNFLYLLKYFVRHLSIADKISFMQGFKESVTASGSKTDAILHFSRLLEADKRKQDPTSKKTKKAPGNTSKVQPSETSVSDHMSVHDSSFDDDEMNISEGDD